MANKNKSKLWPVLEELDTDPETILECLQSKRRETINDLLTADSADEAHFHNNAIHDMSQVIIDLEQEVQRRITRSLLPISE